MRTYSSDTFHSFNESYTKELRLVLKIDFPTPLYLASHDDIPNIPVGALAHTIKNVSSSSQRLSPDTGRSTIGSIKLDVVDAAGAVSTRFNTEEVAGEGLTGRKIELYRGGAGMDWADFRLEQTQQISQSVSYKNGGYKIQCADIQRAMRRDIFDLAVTTLRSDFDAGASTIDVHNTDDFEACTHVASFGEQPTGSYFYFKIKYENGFEIVRATGKTGGATPTFTGCVRARFGTVDVNHVFPIGEDDDSSIEIEEYVYLELPAPAMAHALLTGDLPGGGTIPARWNLGISATNFVNTDSFQNIGDDWFDAADYSKGLIFRFQNVGKTDGKRFIEREVYLLAGAFSTIGADGKINLRRMTGVISTADYVQELTPDNIVKHGSLKHDLSRVRNTFDIEWSWVHFPSEEKPRFVRRNILVDATSQGIHGESKSYALRFKGLHNERHTYTTLINRFDAVRDRFAGPPLTIELELLPTENNLEVGDICRVFLPNVQDFTTGGHLDRSMEIQRITIDQSSGKLKASMFGSSLKADPIVDAGAGANSELPDAWYNAAGTEFVAAGLSIDGSGILQSNGTLTGGTTTRTIFYYLGDFTIPTGTTLTCSGNCELRVRGHFQINGTLRGSGGMGTATAGFIGTTYGGPVHFSGNNPPYYTDYRGAPYRVVGRYAAMPVLEIENNAGVLVGIPPDMRGTGGGNGGPVMHWNSGDVTWEQQASGGNGGGGGGSVVTVSRGAGYGVSGETRVSGTNGNLGGVSAIVPNVGVPAGSGGGGAPGCAVHLLDGSSVTFPIIAGNVDASYGISPINVGDGGSQGKARASSPIDLGIACARAQYVPKSRDPYPDYSNDGLGQQDGLSTYFATVYRRAAAPPSTPTTDDGEYNFDTQTLTPPTDWFISPPASDGNPLYVSTTQFQIQGPTGTDPTCVYTTPAVLTTDGAQGDPGTAGNSVYFASAFIRASSAPATPTGGEYNFGTKVLTAPTTPVTWFDTPPASNGDPLYVVNTIAEVNGVTGIDNTLTWTAPAELTNDGADGSQGDAGADGLSVHVSNVYRRKSGTAPITPTGGEYNFTTNALTPPSLWFVEPPAGTDPLYVSTAPWSVQGTTGIDNSTTWTAPAELVRDGQGIRQVVIYSLNDSVITDDTQGTFADPLSGIEAGWTLDVPALASDGDIVYASSRTFTIDAAAPQGASYSTPVIYSRRIDGSDGDTGGVGPTGQRARTVNIFRLNNNSINASSGTFALPLDNNGSWSYDVPALAADNDTVYVAVRTLTDDAAAPQDSAWSTPAIYAQRTDGSDGGTGATGQRARTVLIFRKNSSTISSASGTFADPLAGNGSWFYDVPAITADGDEVYVAVRTFTDNALSPQDANWGTPTVYAQRTDGIQGVPGADAIDTRYPTLYRLNSNSIVSTNGSFADPRAGNTSWNYDIPALATDGDIVYAVSRIFTSDGLSPQETNWSTPAIYAQRTDGSDGGTGPTGDDGQAVRQVNLYKLNDSSLSSSTGGTFADPRIGNTDWNYAVPALVSDGDAVYVATRTFTDDTLAPQDASWSTPVIYAQRTDGSDGGTGPTGDDGADGRDGVIIGGVKPNFGTFSTPNDGEMYIHGLNAAGVPADVDGSFIFEGARVTLTKGYIYCNNQIERGLLVLETGAGTPFTGASSSAKMAAVRLTVTDGVAVFEFDNNSATWQSMTATATMLIIGTYTHPSATDLIETATLVAPLPLSTAIVDAASITATNLRAISATIGTLETRVAGGSPTTPRLILQDSNSPLQIFDTDDATALLELTNTAEGFRIGILGDFIANSIDTSQMFSEAGITHLRGRIGLEEPSGGTGGSLTLLSTTAAYSGTYNVAKNILCDQLGGGGGTGEITSGGNDVTLFWKVAYSTSFEQGLAPDTKGLWVVKWQYSRNSGAWTDVPSASWAVSGNVQQWGNGSSEPYEYSYGFNEERSFVWSGALANDDYVYRTVWTCSDGFTDGNVTVLTANEPIAGGGVIEAHTHSADDIDADVLAVARIPALDYAQDITGTITAGLVGAERGVLFAMADTLTVPANDEGLAPGQLKLEGRATYADWHVQPYQSNLRFWNTSYSVTSQSMQLTSGGVLTLKDGGSSTDWNSAFNWGNHASAGYTTAALTVPKAGGTFTGHIQFNNGVNPVETGKVGTESITTYPIGISVQYAGGASLPTGFGVLVTFQNSINRNFQLYHAKDTLDLYLRRWHSTGSTWADTRFLTEVDIPSPAKLWQHISSGYNSGDVTVSGSAPGSPAQGDVWFDTAAASSVSQLVTVTGYSLSESTAAYGGLNVAGPQRGSYYGIQLNGELTFMWSGSVGGLYNHTGSDWVVQCTESAGLRLYYANAVKLETLTGGVTTTGIHTAGDFRALAYGAAGSPQFSSSSDTDTGMYNESSNVLAFSSAGVRRLQLYATKAYFAPPIQTAGGSMAGTAATSHLSADFLFIDGKEAIDGNDTYMRLNQNGDFTSGVYSPGIIRAAGGFQVGASLAVPHYVTTGYSSGKMTVASSAPGSPSKGDIWFDTS